MTPEQALEAFSRGAMQAALAHTTPVPRPHRKHKPRKPQPQTLGRTIEQEPPQMPLEFDGSPIPPVFTEEQFAQMEAALQGQAPAGTRIPGEGDAQGGARL